MARTPKIRTHNGKNYSTNCFRLNHKYCLNYIGECECGCHGTGDIDPTLIELRKKADREKYANMSDKELAKRNKKVKHMRDIGKLGHN